MGLYCIKNGLYSDGKERVEIVKPIDKWTDEDRKEFLDEVCGRINWTLNSNGEVGVDGNVEMSQMNLKQIPIKFGRVRCRFDCSYNKLTSLTNTPSSVGTSFYCHDQINGHEFTEEEVRAVFKVWKVSVKNTN